MSFDPTGYTLAHEHLHIDLSGFKNNVDCRLDQYAFICQEMNDLMARGVRNVIEMTNRYMGRNAQFMLDVMRDVYKRQSTYRPHASCLFPKQIAPRFTISSAKSSTKARIRSVCLLYTSQQDAQGRWQFEYQLTRKVSDEHVL